MRNEVWEKVADTEGDAHYIYTSHTKDKKKNPLDYNTKVGLIESALKENSINAENITLNNICNGYILYLIKDKIYIRHCRTYVPQWRI